MNSIEELRARLIAAQRQTGQSSYERRAPSAKAVAPLLALRSELAEFLSHDPRSAEAHRLLSLVHECLLNYPAARTSLDAALSLSGRRDAKDLKRLALLREYEQEWKELPFTPDELATLGRFLEQALAQTPCDHTHAHTRMWLSEHSPGKIDSKLMALRHQGGHCDCEVRYNVAFN